MLHAQREKDDRELVETIQRLHELCIPPAAIAKRLHRKESTVRFVIQRGRLPAEQLPLQFSFLNGE